MTDSAYDIANLATDLVAFSPVALKLAQVIDDKTSSAETIAEIIQQDAALTGSILKLANSPYYGFSQEIAEISDAISRIGTAEVYRIALGVSASKTFRGISETLISIEDFWSHSILCALSAQELMEAFQLTATGSIYAAGLLHDIGELILFANRPELATEALEKCLENYEENDQAVIEKQIFGFTHAEVGQQLAKMWHFPELLQECIAYHHEPELAKKYKHEAELIKMANILAIMIEIETYDIADVPGVDVSTLNRFNEYSIDIVSLCKRIESKHLENKKIILDAMV